MKRVTYVNLGFVTDDRVADALMSYARTLSLIDSADVVNVPGLDEAGVLRTFEMVIGPASQIISNGVDDERVEMAAEEVEKDLRQRQLQRLPPAEGVLLAALPPEHALATDLNDPNPPAAG
jgi:hypothetical protein